MSAATFNARRLTDGTLDLECVELLTLWFQITFNRLPTSADEQLVQDGLFGALTRHALLSTVRINLQWPLPKLADGRMPLVTSGFRHPDRPDHVGLDMFYDYKKGDEPSLVGDGLAASTNLTPRWVVPFGTRAIAAHPGKIIAASSTPTGKRVILEHDYLHYRTGYFHLSTLEVKRGDIVAAGDPLGEVGNNPADHDANHLHFEFYVYPFFHNADPTPFLDR